VAELVVVNMNIEKKDVKYVKALEFVFTKNVENFATTQNAMAVQCSVVFQAAIKFLAKSTGATA
jgi:hypothetical protein